MNIWPNFRKISFLDKVFRSCSPDLIEKNVMQKVIRDNNIQLVIDFRNEGEKKLNTDEISRLVQYNNFPLIAENDLFRQLKFPTPKDYIEYYISILENSKQTIVETLNYIANNIHNNNILIFCHAGKDRTGIIAWLLQELSSIPQNKIIDEYVITSKMLTKNCNIFQHNWEKKQISKNDYLPRLQVTSDILLGAMGYIEKKSNNIDDFFNFNFNLTREILKNYRENI